MIKNILEQVSITISFALHAFLLSYLISQSLYGELNKIFMFGIIVVFIITKWIIKY